MARRRHPGERHRQGRRARPVAADEIQRMRCPCCGTTVDMLGANLERLAEAAQAAFGVHAQVAMDLSALPEVDWSQPVGDEVIARAVRDAMECEA